MPASAAALVLIFLNQAIYFFASIVGIIRDLRERSGYLFFFLTFYHH